MRFKLRTYVDCEIFVCKITSLNHTIYRSANLLRGRMFEGWGMPLRLFHAEIKLSVTVPIKIIYIVWKQSRYYSIRCNAHLH